MSQKENMTYEKAMKRIEEISEAMEDENLSLEASSELFEEAVKLIAFCSEKLKETELKITTITEKGILK